MDFLAISGCDTSLYHSQGGATVLSLHFGMTVIKMLYFIPNSRKSNSNSDRFLLYDFVVLQAH